MQGNASTQDEAIRHWQERLLGAQVSAGNIRQVKTRAPSNLNLSG